MERYAGTLLSVTSLPSEYGIGCFSKSAYDFVDWLEKSGQRYWQILPLGPVSHGGAYDSPYQAFSAFAGNPYFISLEDLVEEGVLTEAECRDTDFGSDPSQVDYEKLYQNRLPLLYKAYTRSKISDNARFRDFSRENAWWLNDYALFMAVKDFFNGAPWYEWPNDIRMHWDNAITYYQEKLYFQVEFQKYLQYTFSVQWKKLKKYANDRHIEIVGDIPIYVSLDGADVWAHPELFQLDENNRQTRVAGCPPDGFTPDGQLWGNPLYRWEYHKQTDFQWWVTRLWYSFQLYDVVRIDHFRGFDEYYSIPAGEPTARNGCWEQGPGMALFDALRRNLGDRKIIAEDLGFMTDTVRELVEDSGFPNMKVLEFAFDPEDEGGANEYLPHNYPPNCVVYTGTHDNSTVSGWFRGLTKEQKAQVRDYLADRRTPIGDIHKSLVSLAMGSCADTCIIPVQDYLGLDDSARMNTPGTVGINWRWRLAPGQLTEALGEEVLGMVKRYGRANWDALPKKEPQEEAEAEDEPQDEE